MNIEYDANKNLKNISERGLSFEITNDFDFENADFQQDFRHSDEIRMKAVSSIEEAIYTLIFTMRGDAVRVISLRLANKKERERWLKNQTPI